nr:hypothetical protein [uncultured Desulfobulbus sp.]
MKKSQRDTYTLTEDFEDLTLFANESFDTQDVDLFEFTSEESSPLTRLKSIILSLDWEINDEILQELADEIGNLQPMWQGDKVAEVYLQGLAKIGNYIRTKGAYAHPNSIKLLLTFFYNFEKIISSPDISGDQITQLLKGDVRKFKILQYQITRSEQGEELPQEDFSFIPVPTDHGTVSPPEDAPPTQLLKAAILGLDWEVTDESLVQFNANLAACHQQMTENKPALVLLQGLQALGDYIADERANSHPDAFTLLHSFNEALDRVTTQSPPDENEVQELLVDRINRLNNLKMVIANTEATASVDEALIAGVVEEISGPTTYHQPENFEATIEEISSPVSPAVEEPAAESHPPEEDTFSLGDEIDSIFGMEAKPAMETADEQYPDEILPPDAIHPVDDELADDLIGAQLSSKRGFAPALSETEEDAGFNVDAADMDLPEQNDLAEQLDFLFADSEDSELVLEDTSTGNEGISLPEFSMDEPIAALADVEFSLEETGEKGEEPVLTPVLEESVLDIESKLDSFFTDTDEQPVETVSSDAKAEAAENSLFFEDAASPTAALADSDEQGGFSEEEVVASLNHSPLDEIEQKLDFFFGDELGEAAEAEVADREADQALSGPAPALSGFATETEEELPVAAPNGEEETTELSGALDAFFDADTQSADTEVAVAVDAEDTLTEALEATFDGGQQPVVAAAGFPASLSTLGALLPGAVRALDREKLREADSMLASLQLSSPSNEHKALTQLLQSVVTMLSRLPAKSEAETEKLINYLYEQLLADTLAPSVLITAVDKFNRWMQAASALMPLVPTVEQQEDEAVPGPQFNYTAKELYFELAQLRLYMNEEFSKIRHHLQHHH